MGPDASRADVDVIPRLRQFISMAAEVPNVRDGSTLSLDSAEWYMEGALNYSISEAWIECTEQTVDSILVTMSSGAGMVESGVAAATFTQMFTMISSMLVVGENHLVVADVIVGDTQNGSVDVLVILVIGYGYERYGGLITSYGPDDYFVYGGSGLTIPNCGCGPNAGGEGVCSDLQIEHRIHQTIEHLADCFYTDVQSRFVNVNAWDGNTYWVSQQFPTGIPATPYKVYYCQNAFLCETCFSPEVLEFYTQSTYDVMMQLRPSQKVVISADIMGVQTLEAPENTQYAHRAGFRYGIQNCRR